MKMRAFIAAGLFLVVSGCGYRMVSGSTVLGHERVFVGTILEDGAEPGLAQRLQRDLAHSLARRGVRLAWSEQDASLVLRGKVSRLSMNPGAATYGAVSAPSYNIYAGASIWAETQDGSVIWRSGTINLHEVLLAGRGMGSSQLDILATEANRRKSMNTLSAGVVAEVFRRIHLQTLEDGEAAP